jgi:hypothetical protein
MPSSCCASCVHNCALTSQSVHDYPCLSQHTGCSSPSGSGANLVVIINKCACRSSGGYTMTAQLQVQSQVNSYETRGDRSRSGAVFFPSFFGFPLIFVIPPLLHTYDRPSDVCNNPDQAALITSSRLQLSGRLAGDRVRYFRIVRHFMLNTRVSQEVSFPVLFL